MTQGSLADRSGFLRGALFIIASELMFASAGAAVKAASTTLPTEMAVFARNLFGLLLLAPLILRHGVVASLATRVLHLHLLRAVVGLVGMYCFYIALAYLHLADGILLKMTAPIFIPLIAFAWLDERLSRYVVIAVPVGFVGVALVLSPQGDFSWVALIGLTGGVFSAWAKVTVRKLTRTEPAVRVVFYFALLATGISALPLIWAWRAPAAHELLLLFTVGVFATLGQLTLTRGYAAAPASRAGPFTYFGVVFAAALGYLFWDETVTAGFIAGALLIAVAGVMAVYTRRDTVTPARPPAVAPLAGATRADNA